MAKTGINAIRIKVTKLGIVTMLEDILINYEFQITNYALGHE